MAALASSSALAAAIEPPRAGADGERTIVAFLCRECAYSAADAAGNARTPLPPTIRTVLVPCTGRVSPLHVLSALAEGADGVYLAGCLEGQCHHRVGNLHALDRVAFVKELLASVGVEPERAAMFTMSAADTAALRRHRPRHARDHRPPAAAPEGLTDASQRSWQAGRRRARRDGRRRSAPG